LFNCREGETLFDGLGHSYHIKRTSKISRTWRCNRHAKPHYCRAVVFQKLATTSFLLKVQHTCPPNLDVDRDASLIARAKANAFANPLISARKVVEKELVKVHEKDTERHLPVVANIVRAVQRKKQSAFPKNPTDLHFQWGKYFKSVIKVFFTVFLYNCSRSIRALHTRRLLPRRYSIGVTQTVCASHYICNGSATSPFTPCKKVVR
jgi:hypothetical protein